MKPTYQNKPQQSRQEQRQDRNDKRLNGGENASKGKTSVAEMLAAAQAFTHGAAGKKTAEAASFFGNQAMLALAEQGAAQRTAAKAAGDVLLGEPFGGFSENSPDNEITPEAAFSPVSVPAFSAEAPLCDIQQVYDMASDILM